MAVTPKTIYLRGTQPRSEALAAAGITPGHLIQLDSDGKFKVHASAGIAAAKCFAIEDDLQGKVITDAYVAADIVQAVYALPGDDIYALLANGESVSIGDVLCSNGNGELKETTLDSSGIVIEEYPLAVALEAVDMSDSSGADPATARIKVRVM